MARKFRCSIYKRKKTKIYDERREEKLKGIHKKLVPIILAVAMILSTCFSNLGTIVYANREQTVTTLEQLSELPPECSEDEEHCALNLLQQITHPLGEDRKSTL